MAAIKKKPLVLYIRAAITKHILVTTGFRSGVVCAIILQGQKASNPFSMAWIRRTRPCIRVQANRKKTRLHQLLTAEMAATVDEKQTSVGNCK